MPTNQLDYNPATDGSNDSKYINRVGAIIHDKFGNDVDETNPLSVTSGLSLDSYDYVAATYPTSTSEVYTFKTGGSGGTTVATITLTYTDATKGSLSTVEKA